MVEFVLSLTMVMTAMDQKMFSAPLQPTNRTQFHPIFSFAFLFRQLMVALRQVVAVFLKEKQIQLNLVLIYNQKKCSNENETYIIVLFH